MTNYKEIVTKAVIGKVKKNNNMHFSFTPDEVANTILGCWVINHDFSGIEENHKVRVNGAFDVNVWYSYDNDTKTKVNTKRFSYTELFSVPLKEDTNLTSDSEVIVRSLKQPSVLKADIVNGDISLDISKELGIEIVGDTKIRVPVEDDLDDYIELDDDLIDNMEINEEYLNDNGDVSSKNA